MEGRGWRRDEPGTESLFVIPDLARVAPQILARASGESESPKELAARAVQACEQFVRHTSRLLGDLAVDLLFERSLGLAGNSLAWLRLPKQESAVQVRAALQAALEHQDPASIVGGFVAILSAFVGILERLIGPGLVAHVLYEVWPTVFVPEAKDVP